MVFKWMIDVNRSVGIWVTYVTKYSNIVVSLNTESHMSNPQCLLKQNYVQMKEVILFS